MTSVRVAALAVLVLWSVLPAAPEAAAQAADPMQRSFVFKNDTPVPIYPVISARRTRTAIRATTACSASS